MNTKELVKREEMLLNDWAKVCPGMVKDGIVNVDEYLKGHSIDVGEVLKNN